MLLLLEQNMECTAPIDIEINSPKVPNCPLLEGYVRRKITPPVPFVRGSKAEYDIKLIQQQPPVTLEGALPSPCLPPLQLPVSSIASTLAFTCG